MELISTPENPVPRGAECTRVVTNDGFHLRAMSVRVSNPRGTVVILGGRADFMWPRSICAGKAAPSG